MRLMVTTPKRKKDDEEDGDKEEDEDEEDEKDEEYEGDEEDEKEGDNTCSVRRMAWQWSLVCLLLHVCRLTYCLIACRFQVSALYLLKRR